MAERLNEKEREVLSCVQKHTTSNFLPATTRTIQKEAGLLSDEVLVAVVKLHSMKLLERKSEGWLEPYYAATEKAKVALKK